MKATIICPNCAASFSVSSENVGKRAKCRKCQKPFVIQIDGEILPPEPAVGQATVPPPVSAKPVTFPTPSKTSTRIRSGSNSNRVTIPLWALIVVASIASLVIGYFAGREHLKYQMRTAIADASKAFAEGFQSDFGNDSFSSAASSNSESVSDTPKPLPTLTIGQTHTADGFSLTLVNARIEKPQVKDMIGDVGVGQNPNLVLQLKVENTDERRILRFREGNMFSGGNFRLRDDVDNVIRGISYGVGSHPVGALTGSEDIAPGESATHIELFSVPPPKTEHLMLTVNLACFGGQGDVEFQIPANKIQR